MLSTIFLLLSLWILTVGTTLTLKDVFRPHLEGAHTIFLPLCLGIVLGIAYKVQWHPLGAMMVLMGLLNVSIGPHRFLGILGLLLYWSS